MEGQYGAFGSPLKTRLSAAAEPGRSPAASPRRLKDQLIARAKAEGFDLVRIAAPAAIPEAGGRLQDFLQKGRHAGMGWLAERADERGDPRRLWPEVRSIIVLGMNYGPATDPLAGLADRSGAIISVYARGDDYHEVIKPRLKRIGNWLGGASGKPLKVFVDTAPVMEKPLAEVAGLGWQGKHTNLVNREFGSWLFLGAIFSAAELPFDEREAEHCGSCRACLEICPTKAFPAPFQIDAGRCISYLTIEHKGVIPFEFRQAIGNRIYGCDDCLAVCPWNKFARQAGEHRFAARDALISPRLADLVRLDDVNFRALFAKSPIKRIGRDRFIRNVLIAIGNSGDPDLAGPAAAHLDDASPLVRGMAVWALSQLDPSSLAAEAHRIEAEEDEGVRAEWREAGF